MNKKAKWCRVLVAALAVSWLGGCQTAQKPEAQKPPASAAPQPGGQQPSGQPGVPQPTGEQPPAQLPAIQQPSAQAPSSQTPSAGKAPATPAAPAAPAASPAQPASGASQGKLPTPDHIVIVIEENHSYPQIVGSQKAAYFNQLMKQGALLTNSYGVAHPSQPNYLALFSGSTQGMTSDACGKTYDTLNLASELLDKKLTFVGYSEDLPKAGYTGCSSKGYARKHNPWVQFTNVPPELNQPLTAFPQDFSKLPTVSFVIPNHQSDMHDGTVEQADTWLKEHLGGYVDWAAAHNSLLLVTWDEDDNSKNNHIPTFFVGPMVKPGSYDMKVNHYTVLRTIQDMYKLKPLGESEREQPITAIWK